MRSPWLRRVGFSLCLAVALGYLPYRVYRESGLSRYVELRGELRQLVARNERLREQARRLRAELDGFGPAQWAGARRTADPLPMSAVEAAARDELGLVKPGEVVFQILPAEAPR